MAFSLNRAQLIGNLTKDPEIKTTPGGQKVATFSIATNFTWKDQTGQKKEKVEFHNIVAWRRLAEIAELYVKKGRKIYVEGRMQTRDWEGEDGVKRYRTEIVADNFIMLDGKRDDSAGDGSVMEGAPIPASAPAYPRSQGIVKKPLSEPAAEEEVSLEDLPF